jgi:hypothetical protein
LNVKRNETIIKESPLVLPDKVEPLKKIKEIAPSIADITEHDKTLKIQARAHSYKQNIKPVIEVAPENSAARNALTFLSITNPTPKIYEDLINRILKNKPDKEKNIKALSLKQKQVLIENISWQYFDRICFTTKNISSIANEEALYNHLRKNKIDMHALFEGWKSDEIKQLEPGINIRKIKKYILG